MMENIPQSQFHIPLGFPIVMDLKRTADSLSVSESTVQKLVREGKFPKPRQLSSHRVGWLTWEICAWAAELPESNFLPPVNTGAPKAKRLVEGGAA